MEFIVYLLKGARLDELANFLPIITVHSLLLNYQLFLFLIKRTLHFLLLMNLIPSSIKLKSRFEIRCWCQLYKIYHSWIYKQIYVFNLLLLIDWFVACKLFHKLTVTFCSIFYRLLLLHHLGLFSKGLWSAAIKFEITDNCWSRRILAIESIGANELVYGFHALVNGVAYFWMGWVLLLSFSCVLWLWASIFRSSFSCSV